MYMRGDELTSFLQICYDTLKKWIRDGFLAVDDRAEPDPGPLGHPLFAYPSIEAFLRTSYPAPEDAPSLVELMVLSKLVEMPPLLTRKQASAALGISVRSLGIVLAQTKTELRFIRLVPDGTIRIFVSDFVEYAAKREARS